MQLLCSARGSLRGGVVVEEDALFGKVIVETLCVKIGYGEL